MHPSAVAADCRSDAELVAAARTGDPTAFEVIMRRNNRLLFRTARGVVPDDAEAQDVVQETYLRAFTSLEGFRGEAALGTWLARITINVALSAQRKRGRIVHLAELVHPGEDSPAAEFTEETAMSRSMFRFPPDDAPDDDSPDAQAERAQVRQILQAAVEHLPVIYRSVFILRAVEEMSVEDAAYCLGVSGDVVKTRFLRARAMLRDALADQMQPYLRGAFAFAGARCDAVVGHVLGELRSRGLVTLH